MSWLLLSCLLLCAVYLYCLKQKGFAAFSALNEGLRIVLTFPLSLR